MPTSATGLQPLDLAYYRNREIQWTPAIGVFPWVATVDGNALSLGLTQSRGEYRLMVNGDDRGHFTEWPANWEKMMLLTPEQRWLASHESEYRGQWIALDGDRLIAHSTDSKSVFRRAQEATSNTPFVKFIDNDDLPWGGW